MIGYFRQLKFPPEFRISRLSRLPGTKFDLSKALETLDNLASQLPAESIVSEGQQEFIIRVSTEVWRLNDRISALKGEVKSQKMKRISRCLNRIDDLLSQSGIEVCDYCGEEYQSEMAVKVLTYQPSPEVKEGEEKIIETVKPTIFINGKIISNGQVIIGLPMEEGGNDNDKKHN